MNVEKSYPSAQGKSLCAKYFKWVKSLLFLHSLSLSFSHRHSCCPSSFPLPYSPPSPSLSLCLSHRLSVLGDGCSYADNSQESPSTTRPTGSHGRAATITSHQPSVHLSSLLYAQILEAGTYAGICIELSGAPESCQIGA